MIKTDFSKLPIKKKISIFMDILSSLTQDEANFILDIIKWDDETKISFKQAKKIFEEELKHHD